MPASKRNQKGGSLASDAVTSLVSSETFAKMNTSFTNQAGGNSKLCNKCGGAMQRKGGKSEPAPALDAFLPRRGGQHEDYKLFHKRGGADTLGLSYDTITTTNNMYGNNSIKAIQANQAIQNRILGTEKVSSLPLMNKVVEHGNLFNSQSKFSYNNSIAGGSKKKSPNGKKQKKSPVRSKKTTPKK